MNIWFPYVRTGSGADIFANRFRDSLRRLGLQVQLCPLPYFLQFNPWLLRAINQPPNTEVTVANSWQAFAFKRHGTPLVTMEYHCIFDPLYIQKRSMLQRIFHKHFIRKFSLLSFRASNAIIAISKYTCTSLHNGLGIEASDMIYPAVDTDFFHPGTRISKGHRGPMRLLFVGNLIHRKGGDLLPVIMQRLGDRAILRYTSGLRTRHRLTAADNMHALGHLTDARLREEYQQADALLMPSRLEGFGYAAAEAMACGTTVIASDSSSLPELIHERETGLLCPSEDVDAFARAAINLADEPDLLTKMGLAGRADMLNRFSMIRMAHKYSAVLTRILTVWKSR